MPRSHTAVHRNWIHSVTDLFRRHPALEQADTTAAYLAESVRWSA